jgi:heme O synthase-like polyprenyltransferase
MMSKLQKAAWFNLGVVTVCMIIAMPCFFFLTSRNAKGVGYLLICFIVACITTPLFYTFYRKKSYEADFDEREKMINRRAFSFSAMGLIIFLACICFVPFFILGGQNVVKVYYLPLIFLSTLFAAQFVHSVAILIQCSLEEKNG